MFQLTDTQEKPTTGPKKTKLNIVTLADEQQFVVVVVVVVVGR